METVIKSFDELTTDELYEILRVRSSVFVVEQKCPFQEIDEVDRRATHIYMRDNDGIKAYIRVVEKGAALEEVSVGRVMTLERGTGLGAKIVAEGIKVAREKYGADKILIEAQTYAQGFYEKSGFKRISDEFIIDDISHVRMIYEA